MNRMLTLALLLIASSAGAADNGYKFTIALDEKGFALSEPSGTVWKANTASCQGKLCEVQINANSITATSDTAAARSKVAGSLDLGFKHVDFKTIRVRCLRESGCNIRITRGPDTPVVKTLASLQGVYIRSGSTIEFTAIPEPAEPSASSQSR